MAADGHLGYTKNGYNFATGLPMDVLFGSRVGFSGTAEVMVHFRISKIQYGGIHALLSRVTLASAGLSC